MLIAAGILDMNKLVDGIISMAKDEFEDHEYNKEKGRGSYTNRQGWGVAYLDDKGKWVVERSLKPIYEDSEIDKFRDLKTKLVIFHARMKTKGVVAYENTHPFNVADPFIGETILFHNGWIKEDITFEDKFKIKGDTDSEQLFYSLLGKLNDKKPIEDVIINELDSYKDITGNNIIFCTEENSYIGIKYKEAPIYYTMRLSEDKDSLIVSSEELTNIPNRKWTNLDNGEVVKINNYDLSFSKFK